MGRNAKYCDREEWLSNPALYGTKRGNELPQAKLKPEIVRQIRANKNGWPRWKWAELLGLHIRTIDKVCDFRSWRNV